MTGIIWFTQLVQYPLMAEFDSGSMVSSARKCQIRTMALVLPIMIVEMLSGLWLVSLPGDGMTSLLLRAELALLMGIWGHTRFRMMGIHKELTLDPQPDSVQRLVRSNWVRTVGWTIRAVILVYTTL